MSYELYFTSGSTTGESPSNHPSLRPGATPRKFPPLREKQRLQRFGIDSNSPNSPSLICQRALLDYCLLKEALDKGLGGLLQLGLEILAEGTLLVNAGQQARLVGLEVGEEACLEFENAVDGDLVKVTVDTGEDEGNHLVDGHGGVLLLLEELGQLMG